MDREKDLASAVACRCEAISEAVGLRRSTGIDFVRNVIDAFPAERSGPAADRAWRTRAYLLSQAFHCRVPTAMVKPMLQAAWDRGSAADRAIGGRDRRARADAPDVASGAT